MSLTLLSSENEDKLTQEAQRLESTIVRPGCSEDWQVSGRLFHYTIKGYRLSIAFFENGIEDSVVLVDLALTILLMIRQDGFSRLEDPNFVFHLPFGTKTKVKSKNSTPASVSNTKSSIIPSNSHTHQLPQQLPQSQFGDSKIKQPANSTQYAQPPLQSQILRSPNNPNESTELHPIYSSTQPEIIRKEMKEKFEKIGVYKSNSLVDLLVSHGVTNEMIQKGPKNELEKMVQSFSILCDFFNYFSIIFQLFLIFVLTRFFLQKITVLKHDLKILCEYLDG
jgi:hypothetical protein